MEDDLRESEKQLQQSLPFDQLTWESVCNYEPDEALVALLEKRVAYFLDKEVEKFMSILYRIDVDEQKLKWALTQNNPAREIALLIIDRQLRKLYFRNKYSA